MRSETFDVVILGGGNAGIGVTGPVRRAGMSVAMIESDVLGGTCPNRGCTPKKVLVAAGHALHDIERAAIHHISVCQKLGEQRHHKQNEENPERPIAAPVGFEILPTPPVDR